MPPVNGILRKMNTHYTPETNQVSYALNLDGQEVLSLNPLIGSEVCLEFGGFIHCVACHRKISKTFNNGYCYPCFTSLAQCDVCIMQPQKCHYHLGTCREPAWGKQYCFQQHTLYLARSSSVKIGITRSAQQVHRWMDQGAVEAQVVGFFEDRYQVGQAEAAIANIMADKTNWRKMLKNEVSDADFAPYFQKISHVLSEKQGAFLMADGPSYAFAYPVQTYPQKVVSKKLEKFPKLQGRLVGIKGQYLIFEDYVVNLRTHGGYQIAFSC